MFKEESTIFISYSHIDKAIANEIDKDLTLKGFRIVLDERELEYKGSIRKYMERINSTDFALLIISDSFLKSKNCMYEILELQKSPDYEKRILPVIVKGIKIYDVRDRISYLGYWEMKIRDLEADMLTGQLSKRNSVNEELDQFVDIRNNIDEFLKILIKNYHQEFEKLKSEDYGPLIKYIKNYQHKYITIKVLGQDSIISQKKIKTKNEAGNDFIIFKRGISSVLDYFRGRRISIMVILLLLSILSALFITKDFLLKRFSWITGSNESVVIGSLLPLTGEGVYFGEQAKDGIIIALDEINRHKYLPKPVEVIFEDTRLEPKLAIQSYQHLKTNKDIKVIIGPLTSFETLALAPMVNQDKKVLITGSATTLAIKKAGDYIFRTVSTSADQGMRVAEFCNRYLMVDTVCILSENAYNYSMEIVEAFENSYDGKVFRYDYKDYNNDINSILKKIKAKRFPVIFYISVDPKYGEVVLKKCMELQINSTYILSEEIADNYTNYSNWQFPYPFYGISSNYIEKKMLRDMNKVDSFFMKHQNAGASLMTYKYYELTKIVVNAIKQNGNNSEGVKNYLYSQNAKNAYNGLTGTISFDNNGEVGNLYKMFTYKNNIKIPIDF